MGLFDKSKNNGGFMDQIRCDEPSYLIWKWHPAGSELGNNTRENAIRLPYLGFSFIKKGLLKNNRRPARFGRGVCSPWGITSPVDSVD